MSEIQPALTAAEWAEKYVERDAPGAMLSIDADAFGALVIESGAASEEPVTITVPRTSAALSALVALANDAREDAGKLTRAMVAAIRRTAQLAHDAADEYRGDSWSVDAMADAAAARKAAAALESILPPEAP